ncbi:MAG: hypothetical protein JWP19_266 [Rhodoglobus sp.]|nr:hypothetical protein [Rhodoglobus sp.]
MADPRLLDQLAALVDDSGWGSLPPSTVAAAERATLHVLATTYLGADRDIAQRTTAYARRNFPGGSTLIGHGRTVAPTEAAFANATMCHADFRDDAHSPSQSHPGVTVIPAALAAAEMLGTDLPAGALGTAVVAGYQVIGRLGRLGAITSTARGFRASAIYTVFGAAAAAAHVLGLDRKQLTSALSLAAQTAAGLNQPYYDGTDDWILLPGLAARNGLVAALLAREGIVGAPNNLDGRIGMLGAYADLHGAQHLDATGLPDWEVEVTRLKTVLTCGWNQAPVNTVLMSGIPVDSIDTLEVAMSPEAYEFPGVANYGPFETYTASVLSMPFAFGALLGTGQLTARTYRDVGSPAVVENARRLTMRPEGDFHGYDCVVTVTQKDGTVQALEAPGGPPRWLLTWPEVVNGLRTKFEEGDLDTAKVDALAAAVPAALAGTSIAGLLDILGQPA